MEDEGNAVSPHTVGVNQRMGAITAPILSIGLIWPSKAPWLGGDILVLPLPFRGLVGQNDSRSLLKSLEQ